MDRNLTPELMDDPALDPVRHGQALRGLARLNRVSGADRIPWHAIRDWAGGGLPYEASDDLPFALSLVPKPLPLTLGSPDMPARPEATI